MPFTGRLGTDNSQPGNIVLGIVDTFELGTFGFDVNVLASDQIRVRFDKPVTSTTALRTNAYNLVSLASIGTAVVPPILSVDFYDADRKSVVLHLAYALTFNTVYSIQPTGILDDSGEAIAGAAKNFTATVKDPPRVLGAYMSLRGFVDILFSHPVGPYSTSATASIRNAAGGGGVSMPLFAWDPSIPDTTVRFYVPAGMPSANSYLIDLTNIVDQSLNVNSETTDFDLVLRSPQPYSYAALTQVQIIDAYVADVSNDFINTATVRVYFNCPLDYLQSKNTANWSVSFTNTHKNTDTLDNITSADATTLGTLITLSNELRAKINTHEVNNGVHFINDTFNTITAPACGDYPTAATLLNDIQNKYLSHLIQRDIHLYQDGIHNFVFQDAFGSLGLAFSIANLIKSSYNSHLLSAYPASFSTQYGTGSIIPPIFPFASLNTPVASDVLSETGAYTYFVDLHVACAMNGAPIRVTTHVQSEDLGSTTNPADYSGSIIARASNSPAIALSSEVYPESSCIVQFDREISLLNSDNVDIQDKSTGNLFSGLKFASDPDLSATLPSVIWILDQLMFAYANHIGVTGAGHQVQDNINIPSSTDYVTSIDLSPAITIANKLLNFLNSHMQNSVFHYNADNAIIQSSPATDFPSLVKLVQNLRLTFIRHNSAGDHTNNSTSVPVVPQNPGVHAFPGPRIVSARLFNLLRANFRPMVDGTSYMLTARIQDSYYDNRLGMSFIHKTNLNQSFVGIALRPSLASALPILGYISTNPNARLHPDSVEVYFSKPMYQVPITFSNLPLTGGSILVGNSSWVNDKVASLIVSGMTIISYTVNAVGLTDAAGNPVY